MFLAGDGVDASTSSASRSPTTTLLRRAQREPATDLELTLPDAAGARRCPAVGAASSTRSTPRHDAARERSGEPRPLRARSAEGSYLTLGAVASSDADVSRALHTSGATYRAAAPPGVRVRRAAAIVPTTSRSSGSATSTRRRTSRPARAARTATTSSTTTALNPELGGADGSRAAVAALARARHGPGPRRRAEPHGRRLGREPVVVDVLENGPASLYARVLRHRLGIRRRRSSRTSVLLPVLGDQYGAGARARRARRSCATAALPRRVLRARAARSPPRSYRLILQLASHELQLQTDDRDLQSCSSILSCARSPAARARDRRDSVEERAPREGGPQAAARRAVPRESATMRERDRRRARAMNGTPGDTRDFDGSMRSCSDQNYRLAYWRVATEEIDYRRFFDVNELAAHPHGGSSASSRRPTSSSRPGRARARSRPAHRPPRRPAAIRRPTSAAAARSRGAPHRQERNCGTSWPRRSSSPARSCRATGRSPARPATTSSPRRTALRRPGGRGAADRAVPAAHRRADRLRAMVVARRSARSCRRACSPARSTCLGRRLRRIAEATAARATSRSRRCASALARAIAAFPVYRTYVAPRTARAEPNDDGAHRARDRGREAQEPRDSIRRCSTSCATCCCCACSRGRRERELRDALPAAHRAGDGQGRRGHRVLPLQPAGLAQRGRRRPGAFGASRRRVPRARTRRALGALAARRCSPRRRTTPSAARTSARGSRCCRRCRDEWERRSHAGTRMRSSWRRRSAPDRNDRVSAVYQTLVGAWPIERPTLPAVVAYMEKALREAKVHTSWTDPDERLRGRRLRAVRASVLGDDAFLADFAAFVAPLIAPYGACNSLAQDAAQADVARRARHLPGQRAVGSVASSIPTTAARSTTRHRRRLLGELSGAQGLVESFADGRIKLHVTRAGLQIAHASGCCSSRVRTGRSRAAST